MLNIFASGSESFQVYWQRREILERFEKPWKWILQYCSKNRTQEEGFLSYKITKALGRNEVDLIELNKQGLIFVHNVLKTGEKEYGNQNRKTF
jgi:hypothetical protein